MTNQETIRDSIAKKEARPAIASSLVIAGLFLTIPYHILTVPYDYGLGEKALRYPPIFFLFTLLGAGVIFFPNKRLRLRGKRKWPTNLAERRLKTKTCSSWLAPALSSGLASVILTAKNTAEACQWSKNYAELAWTFGGSSTSAFGPFPSSAVAGAPIAELLAVQKCSEINVPLVVIIACGVAWIFFAGLVVSIWVFRESFVPVHSSPCRRVLGAITPLLGMLAIFLAPISLVFFDITLPPVFEIFYVVASAGLASWGVTAVWKWIESSPQGISNQPQQQRLHPIVFLGAGLAIGLVLGRKQVSR